MSRSAVRLPMPSLRSPGLAERLLLLTRLRVWRRWPAPSATALLASGLSLSYVLMPLAHHLFATPPGYRYITAASNFFALSVPVQVLVCLTAAAMALGVTHLRRSDWLSLAAKPWRNGQPPRTTG